MVRCRSLLPTLAVTAAMLASPVSGAEKNQIVLIDAPLLMMAGSEADTLYMTEDAFPKATSTSDKEFFKIPGARHIETYWVSEYVEITLGKLVPFFSRTLSA